ncbi:CLUMA_CG005177, isoform A [Clunio marinus]|uniref:Signal recognition particle 14 kDa protein n=1 Tax=Clunio marinus TaxID=568069 RepID=A0A1J1HVX8_9DIPT|nr:CLUMA_CG005177, isoform A [Clunio marinus]
MVLLTSSEFLTQVTILAQKVRSQSAFTITFKQYDGIDKPKPRAGKPQHLESNENYCLIRMKAKNKKLSTVVKKSDISKFMESYGKIMKANMDGLKKIKRVKNKSKALQG